MTDEEIKRLLEHEFECHGLHGLEIEAFKIGYRTAYNAIADRMTGPIGSMPDFTPSRAIRQTPELVLKAVCQLCGNLYDENMMVCPECERKLIESAHNAKIERANTKLP